MSIFITLATAISFIFSSSCCGSNPIIVKLQPYKNFIEAGTYEGQNWTLVKPLPQSRYFTFKTAFLHFEKIRGKTIVELGTSRSFTHGGLQGCNSDDPIYWTPNKPQNWDWGAGLFTRMAAVALDHLNPQIHTVDLCKNHIQRCKLITKDYVNLLQYHVSDSVKYLKECNFPNGIDLLYLDTGDMTPIEPTANLQLMEAMVIVERNLLSKNGILLIDDVKNQTPKKFGESSNLGKSKYSIPYLLDHGYEIIADEYQVIMRKTRNNR